MFAMQHNALAKHILHHARKSRCVFVGPFKYGVVAHGFSNNTFLSGFVSRALFDGIGVHFLHLCLYSCRLLFAWQQLKCVLCI